MLKITYISINYYIFCENSNLIFQFDLLFTSIVYSVYQIVAKFANSKILGLCFNFIILRIRVIYMHLQPITKEKKNLAFRNTLMCC